MPWILTDEWPIHANQFEGEWIVFHGGDSQTHWLTEVNALVFEVFWKTKAPLTKNAVINQVNFLAKHNFEEDIIGLVIDSLVSIKVLRTIN